MSWQALVSTLSSRRFWIWQIGGAIIYLIPVLIRLVSGNVVLPVMGLLETPWIGHWIPGNLVEKIFVNAFFPGAAGAVAGEIFLKNLNGPYQNSKEKHLRRLVGALLWVTIWTLFQWWGNLQSIIASYGGNLFEYPSVYPLNFALAALSIFTPDIVDYVGVKFRRLSKRP
ncbi:MAG: hypothetical protein LBH74_01970 [Nitrososphaerota archaeon]|jgi:hypothetical protein|nr:hypothetical protein [Nitrososphaerota archaeon]